ncbi:MAG: DNA polymerase III subunit alpha [Propionibacteriaceae bacterium]|jgi:error-prone DNA polymerase|nr:DNA polymerase III subunit alpha [Propionibacteriaceae bacterium]
MNEGEMDGFVHLQVASAFSAHYGTASPQELVRAAAEQGAPAAALTDRDGLYGIVRHVRACLEAGVKPIAGVELQIAPSGGDGAGSGVASSLAGGVASRLAGGGASSPATPASITVLAHGGNGGRGWAALCRLISAAWSPKRRPAGRRRAGSAHREAVLRPDDPARLLRGGDGGDGEGEGCGYGGDGEGGGCATVLLGPDSDVGRAVTAGRSDLAHKLLLDWRQRLPGQVVVEVVCHYTKPGTARSLPDAAALWQAARRAEVPAVLANQARYLRPDDAYTGDVLDAAGLLLPLGAFEPQPNAQAWLKPGLEMAKTAARVASFAGLGKVAVNELLAQTSRVAARCCLDPAADLGWRRPKVPELSVLGVRGNPQQVLSQTCQAALAERYPDAVGRQRDAIDDRLRDELAVIAAFGFASYFLTVADVAKLIRDMGVRVQARGSGAGSLVNYLLRVSNVDPLEHDLLFERFLGVRRSTLPDIDIDVESARRHEIYRRIFARYGEHRVTLLSMQNTYRARGAVRDAGLALGLEPEQIDKLASSLWRLNARDIAGRLESGPELRDTAAEIAADPCLARLVELAGRLDRLPRHISMHPCGVILGNADLFSVTPVQPSGLGLSMSQYDKDDIDDMGLLKLDVLGVRMQSAMAHAVREIVRVNGPTAALVGGLPLDAPYVSPEGEIDLDSLPHDDEPTFANIRTTHTLGMFQIESPGQRELVGKMQPDRFADLIADISLFRPGPMKANLVTPFVEAKLGLKPPDYLHPLFRGFLGDSFGVVIYHEHLLRILSLCMGVSLAQADEIRRSMADGTDQLEAVFKARAAAQTDQHGRPLFAPRQVARIWEVVKGFGSFGFCKAHAAAFAVATYQSAWLKTHYPAEFMAGLLEHDPGMYPKRLLVAEARRLGVRILPLDVNASQDEYRVELLPADSDLPSTAVGDSGNAYPSSRMADAHATTRQAWSTAKRGVDAEPGGWAKPADADSPPTLKIGGPAKGIRLSLRDVHGITAAEVERIVERRPYRSIGDFYLRAAPSRRLLTRLGAVGALDSLVDERASRGDVVAYVRRLTASPARPRADDEPPLPLFAADRLETGHQLSRLERVSSELDVLSTEIDEHVVELYRPLLDELGVTPADELLSVRSQTEVLVAGVRVATQTPPTRSGKRVVFLSLDDGTGCADCAFFDEAQQRAGPLLFGTKLLVVAGKTRRTGAKGVSVQADNAWDLKELWRQRFGHSVAS